MELTQGRVQTSK